jgi:hypothetical protein
MRLVQIVQPDRSRRVAIVDDDGNRLTLLDRVETVYGLAQEAIAGNVAIATLAGARTGKERVSYDQVVAERRLLPPLDHPEPARFWITGTGLTHIGSAAARDKMHVAEHGDMAAMTDSMKIFRMGIEGGKPKPGEVGVVPEWFFKGVGTCVVAPEAPIATPAFALAGGEEPEIVGLYVIAPDGSPCRIGYCLGNEFSDHVTEAQNYLYLAHSKLRQCSLGPELLLGELPQDVRGHSRIVRGNEIIWQGEFLSGEANMSHSIRNLEHYHFRYSMFRRPGDAHAYYFGAAILSSAEGVKARIGDRFEIDVPALGRPLRNTMVAEADPGIVAVRAL